MIVTWVCMMLALEDCMVLIQWETLGCGRHWDMTGARDLFVSFTTSDSSMYVELGMGTKHVVQGSGAVVF
jgi:hypothetical protein